jgi:hypothetical protein
MVDGQKNMDYRLKKGDIIKLGRIKFKVKDYRTELCQANIDGKKAMSPSPFEKGKGTGYQEEEYWVGGDDFSEEAIEIDCGVVDATQSDIQCKVCWSNEQSNSNPLLNSCKCDGSVRFIHYECLKHWLKQKMQKKEESNLISYSWKQFECEICKKPYPYIFKSNGRKYRLVDVEVPEDRKFLWLESLTFEKNSSRMVSVASWDVCVVGSGCGCSPYWSFRRRFVVGLVVTTCQVPVRARASPRLSRSHE